MTDLWLFEWIAVTSVSTGNVVGVSVMIPVVILVMIPGLDSLVAVGVSRGYTDHHQGRAIHMADSRIH